MITIDIDQEILNEVYSTVTSDKFIHFLGSNTTDPVSCLFIMQTILDAIKEKEAELNGDR